MTSLSHDPVRTVPEQRRLAPQLSVPEMWAGLAIVTMWLAVLFCALFGPDIENTTSGGDSATVPSAVVVAICAFAGTWVVARYGFRRGRHD